MNTNLLFPPSDAPHGGSERLLSLHRIVQTRLASGRNRNIRFPPTGGRDLGVVRANRNLPDLSPETADLIADLNLDIVFDSMSGGDPYLREVARLLLCTPLQTPEAVLYRQQSVKDALLQPEKMRALYQTTEKAMTETALYKLTHQPGFTETVPMSVKVQKAVGLLSLILGACTQLRANLRDAAPGFASEGFRNLVREVETALTDAFLDTAVRQAEMLSVLVCEEMLVVSVSPGPGLKGQQAVLHTMTAPERMPFTSGGSTGRTASGQPRLTRRQAAPHKGIPLDDISLSRSAAEMSEAALLEVLRMVNRVIEALLHFFTNLRFELAFLVGAAQLADHLDSTGTPFCFPSPATSGISASNIVDLSLALRMGSCPVPNDLAAREASLVIITGANQGGKSTLIRSLGLAQVLLQSGLFVTAAAFSAKLHDAVFTHFSRVEDPSMTRGRLEEELERMDRLLTRMSPHSLLLLNESFSTTTERDGARIASDLILALYESGVTLLYVTHLHECAAGIHDRQLPGTRFLRAERQTDGTRSFRILPGAPQASSHAMDLYQEVMP